MAKIKKRDADAPASGRIHKQREQPDDLLRFSFRHFGVSDKFCYPTPDSAGPYLQTLLERIKHLSSMTVKGFREDKSKALRIHTHKWEKTSEPGGYAHLTEQLQQCEPWQFQLTANEYGRVHGLLIDETFYVVWLDVNHALYP